MARYFNCRKLFNNYFLNYYITQTKKLFSFFNTKSRKTYWRGQPLVLQNLLRKERQRPSSMRAFLPNYVFRKRPGVQALDTLREKICHVCRNPLCWQSNHQALRLILQVYYINFTIFYLVILSISYIYNNRLQQKLW